MHQCFCIIPQGSILGPLLFSTILWMFVRMNYSCTLMTQCSLDQSGHQTTSVQWLLDWTEISAKWKCGQTSGMSPSNQPNARPWYFPGRELHPNSSSTLEIACCQRWTNLIFLVCVTIDSKLTWSKHLSNISTTARQKLGAPRTVANILDTEGRATVYKSQVRSIMEYASLSWMNASPTNLCQLDNIQKKALKVIKVDKVTALFKLNITNLLHRRRVAAVTILYQGYQ